MVVVRNDDRPGMIGVVGTILGDADVSISSMAVGPSATAQHRTDGALHRRRDPRRVPCSSCGETAGISDVHTVRS